MQEEAKTLLPSVLHLQPLGRKAVQDYVDNVCGHMEDADSPGHHIAIEVNGTLIQAHAHHQNSADLGNAMKTAAARPDKQATFERDELIVGTQSQGDTYVFVSETVSQIRSLVYSNELLRMAGILLMGVVAAIVMNLVLTRLVSRPLRQLVSQVHEIGQGSFEFRANNFGNNELNFLSIEINAMSDALAAAEKDRKIRLEKARQIQENLLPTDIAIDGFEFGTIYSPPKRWLAISLISFRMETTVG